MSNGDDTSPAPVRGEQHVQLPTGVDDVAAAEEAELAAVLGGPSEAPAHLADHGTADAPSTRDVLSEIAERNHLVPVHSQLDRRERSFVRWLLGSLAVALVVLLAAMWWLDPISVTGRQTRFSVVENGGVRQAKLDLMEQLSEAPEVLVLGSSRSMKLNPSEIERVAGASAFNGGVSGGTSQDIYLYARYADELWSKQEGGFPHLVIGVVPDVLRFSGTAALDPRLRKFLPRSETRSSPLEQSKELLQLKTLEGAVRSVRHVVRRDGVGALLHPVPENQSVNAEFAVEGRQRGNQLQNLDSRGMQEFSPTGDDSAPLAARIQKQMTTYVKNSYEADAGFTGVDPRGLDLLRQTIELANRNGDVPTLWVTPFAPDAIPYLPTDAYEARNERFRAAITQLEKIPSLQFTFEDLSDISSFGGSATQWHDGIHMTETNTALVIGELQRRGVLTGSSVAP